VGGGRGRRAQSAARAADVELQRRHPKTAPVALHLLQSGGKFFPRPNLTAKASLEATAPYVVDEAGDEVPFEGVEEHV